MVPQTLTNEELNILINQKRYTELPALLTPTQAASVLGVTNRTIQKYCSEGLIEAVHTGHLLRIPTEKFITALGLGK